MFSIVQDERVYYYFTNFVREFLKTYNKEIRQFYQSKTSKKHKAIARNLVALELARIIYYVLKNKTDFNNLFKGNLLSKQKSMQWPRLTSSERCLDAYCVPLG